MRKSWSQGGNRFNSGGSGRLNTLPSPPEDFLGRETEMYIILNAVLNRRLVSVVGIAGVGRSSIVTSLTTYIQERRNTTGISYIFFVRSAQRFGKGLTYIKRLFKQLVEHGWVNSVEGGKEITEEEDMIEVILDVFRKVREWRGSRKTRGWARGAKRRRPRPF